MAMIQVGLLRRQRTKHDLPLSEVLRRLWDQDPRASGDGLWSLSREDA